MKTKIRKEALYETIFKKNYINSFPFNEGFAQVILLKYGAIDQKGDIVIEPKYDELTSFSDGIAIYSLNGRYGYIDNKGRQITDSIFDDAFSFNNGIAIIKLDSNYGVIDKKGNYIIKPRYEKLGYFHQQKLIFKQGNKYGLINLDEEIIKKPLFEEIRYFNNGPCAFKDNEKWGFIDENGEIIIPAKFSSVHSFYNNRSAVEFDKKWGIIDRNGDFVIEPTFDYFARSFSNGLACVKINNKYGFVDSDGKIIIEPKYDSMSRFFDGKAEVSLNGEEILIDTLGNKILNITKFDFKGHFSEGLARVSKDGKYGFIDTNGQIAIPLNYEDAYDFIDGAAHVFLDGKWRIIDTKGKLLFSKGYDYLPCTHSFSDELLIIGNKVYEIINQKGEVQFQIECDWFSGYHDRIAWFKKDGKYGFINTKGEIIIEPILDNVVAQRNDNLFEGWLIEIKQQDKVGIVYKGKKVLPPCYDRIDFSGKIFIIKEDARYKIFDLQGNFMKDLPFENVYGFGKGINSVFRQNGKYGIIDDVGNIIIDAQFDSLDCLIEGYAPFEKNEKWGYINKAGEVVIEPQFDFCSFFDNGYAQIKQNGKYGFIDFKGNIILPPKYENCFYDGKEIFRCKLEDAILFYDNKFHLINKIASHNYVSDFNNLIKIKQGNKYGLVKKDGEIVLEPEYDNISAFSEINIIKLKDKYGIIGKDGNIILPPSLDNIYYDYPSHGISIFELNGKYGFIDKNGNILVEPSFDMLGSLSEGYAQFLQYSKGSTTKGFIKIYINLNDYLSYKLEDIETENEYVSPRVETEISQWSKKGEFEKTLTWKERIANKQIEKLTELTTKYKAEYQAKEREHNELKKSLRDKYFELREQQIREHFSTGKLQISKYDADNETFLIIVDKGFGKIVLPVALEIAPDFKADWKKIRETADLEFIITEDVELKTMTFYYGDKKVVYDSSNDFEYNQVLDDSILP